MTNYRNARDSIENKKSKSKLSDNIKKKIETTMIGSLSSVEKYFGFLWENENISEEQRAKYKEIYNEMRSEILDKGNHQLRNVDAELSNYSIKFDGYRYQFSIPKHFQGE
jgi:ATP-dependent DNA ligase